MNFIIVKTSVNIQNVSVRGPSSVEKLNSYNAKLLQLLYLSNDDDVMGNRNHKR